MHPPKKTYNIISNTENGAGLERDCRLLFDIIDKLGHRVRMINYERPFEGLSYDANVNFFLEVIVPGMMNFAPWNVLIPNSEWFREYDAPCLPRMNQVLCKTHDCYEIWNRKLSGRCVYTGFEASDFYNNTPYQSKEISFLHLAGNSGTKNTEAVVECWRKYRPEYKLDVVVLNPAYRTLCHGIPYLNYHQRIADSHVQFNVNNHWFHLIPSQYEGYGQAIHEALSCGGIVITTDAPPMNEFAGIPKELLIPSSGTFQKSLAICHYVSAEGVYEAVQKAVALSENRRVEMSCLARASFLADRESFRQIFIDLVK